MNHQALTMFVLAACHARAPTPVTGATQEIVYMSLVKTSLGAQGSEVVMMNLDGSDRVQLTDNELQEFLPHFSPDATQVIYTKYTHGGYGTPAATSVVAVVDTATLVETELTSTNYDGYPVWSPDGSRVAFLSMRAQGRSPELWVMNADGSDQHRIGGPAGTSDDEVWGDIAWSSDDWILFVVAQEQEGPCFKVRIDKIRPDGSSRTQVTDGGPNCTPMGLEQSGDADPSFSADGKTIYSSRGFPRAPGGTPPSGTTERQLYAFSSDAWAPGKVETSLALPSEPDCIEGVPKGSPDGTRILEFRACWYQPNEPGGVTLTDTAGSFRTFIADGFGPDWNPN
jgi:Tol biopolymer transport system component